MGLRSLAGPTDPNRMSGPGLISRIQDLVALKAHVRGVNQPTGNEESEQQSVASLGPYGDAVLIHRDPEFVASPFDRLGALDVLFLRDCRRHQ